MTTDASKTGWGGGGGAPAYNGQSAQGGWSSLEREGHINELEILAVYLGLKSFIVDLKGKHVCIKVIILVQYVILRVGTKSIEGNSKSLWLQCMENNIWPMVCLLPRKLNDKFQ